MLLLVSSSMASAIGCCTCEKKVSVLLDAVLEDFEVALLEPGDVLRAVRDGDVQRHELDARRGTVPAARPSVDRQRRDAALPRAPRARRVDHRPDTLVARADGDARARSPSPGSSPAESASPAARR